MSELDAIPAECLSELVLDEWAAGELSAEEQQRCEAHLASCEVCQARKRALEQANTAFYSEAPTFDALERLAPKPKRVRTLNQLRWLSAPLLAACAALAFIAVQKPDQPAPLAETRTKGAPRLGYYLKRGDSVIRGEPATALYPRDAVRFVER